MGFNGTIEAVFNEVSLYQVSLEELTTDHVIARSIFRPNGELLLAKGYRITTSVLKKLPEIEQSAYWVIDEDIEDDINYEELVSEQVINLTTSKLFDDAKQLRGELKANSMTLDEIKGSMEDTKKFKDILSIGKVNSSALSMISDIMDSKSMLINISAIRTRSHYTYQNSVDTTVTALMLGRGFGFKNHELEELAMGTLLMDTGYLVMPEELINRSGRVTYEEYKLLKNHPEYGFKILRENPKLPLISAHIAYQHHECQDGTGYPRQLHGSHLAPIATDEREQGSIHRYAEIASVAEAYVRLSNPKPGITPPSPLEVIKILLKASRSRLNRSVVDKLISLIPIYPVGSRIIIAANTNDRFLGYTGIVSDSNILDLEKPVIHLLFDAEKVKIKPIKIHLEHHPEVIIKHQRLI